MLKNTIKIIVIFVMISIPNMVISSSLDTIFILLDELPIEAIAKIEVHNMALGFVNLRTRTPYSEESLYISINLGRKIGIKDMEKISHIDYLGEILKEEKTSYMGDGDEGVIVGNSEGRTDYSIDNIKYDLKYLIENTNYLLGKSKVLVLKYDLKDDNIGILNHYLNHYKNKQLIIMPKRVADEDKYLLNVYLVPIIYINNEQKGLITSSSTRREGFIALEDISAQIKETYGYRERLNIGKPFKVVYHEYFKEELREIYLKNINLLILSYIFHGINYLILILFSIGILKSKEVNKKMYVYYMFISTNILTSLLLGNFDFHKNIFLYLGINFLLIYFIMKYIVNKRLRKNYINMTTYVVIVFCVYICPDVLYNSYIGFNNIVYGARFYGLNNGIMGVLIVLSIITYYEISSMINSKKLEKIMAIIIFSTNIIGLSTYFGANTGGFITSFVLFAIIIKEQFFSNISIRKYFYVFFIFGVLIFGMNLGLDNIAKDSTHALNFFHRLKVNGASELIYMASFKCKELIKLTILPPFSIVLIFLGASLYVLKEDIFSDKVKKETKIIFIISIIGFLINDTGIITLIYMIYYLILNTLEELDSLI